jgi:hypothetical protein
MSGSRWVLLVLVGLAVLFATSVGIGVHTGSGGKQDPKNYEPESWTKGIGGLLRPFSPKLVLDRKIFKLGGGHSASVTVQVPAADTTLRIGTFVLREGSKATLHYLAAPGASGLEVLRDQKQELPDDKDRRQASLIVLEQGGTLQIECSLEAPCNVELE